MKNLFQFANQNTSVNNSFSQFSAKQILSPESMMKIRGGTGDGGDGTIIPPPPPPKP